jgi:hypothetical protein
VLLGGCLVWWPRRSLETAWSPVISGWLLARSAVLITGHSRPCRSVAATTGVVVNKPVPDVCLVWSHSKNHGRRTCSANNPAWCMVKHGSVFTSCTMCPVKHLCCGLVALTDVEAKVEERRQSMEKMDWN